MTRKPDFDNLLAVLRRKVPSRPTLFEFFLNNSLYARLTGLPIVTDWHSLDRARIGMLAYERAGYDYFTVHPSNLRFPTKEHEHQASRSMNDLAMISDRASFNVYPWPDPDAVDISRLDVLGKECPAGMKLIPYTPGGILENVMSIVGYENLCFILGDDPELAVDVFDHVGSRLLRYYERFVNHPAVGACIVNDDWGFNSQPMLSPGYMRQYVVPWHKKFVECIHGAGKPAILHSCGNLASLMDDIIDTIGFDAKHSYEDKIQSVEDAYEQYGHRIAILGGIDMDFVCRSTPEAISRRAKAMLERTAERGGYALGTGNSVPHYVPEENYFTLISAATGMRY
ncbi:MAG: uroporphyrinogen decarboxylase family protein [Phycisphaerales bacterium]|nr:uroporphyrinogen decarboxylase family protein [Phycisphaerales bacterium]